MKKTLRLFFLLGTALISSKAVTAQYCAPTVTAGSVYIASMQFNYIPSDVQNAQVYSTGYSGYTQTTGSSSGTIRRYRGASIWYAIHNNAGSSKPATFKVYGDWNNDGDFNDPYEYIGSNPMTISGGATTGTSFYIAIPSYAQTGLRRVRFVIAENTTTDACSAVTGEVEDYVLNIAANAAPVLVTAVSPVFNPLATSQTTNTGMLINELMNSRMPNDPVTDANDSAGTINPKGIAITGAIATNGTWQYKIADSVWKNFPAVSPTSALLLLGDGGNSRFNTNTRIRFVPIGAGTPSITFSAWDGTSSLQGVTGDATVNGGTTAFSTTSETVSMNVVSAPASTPVFFASLQDTTLYKGNIDRSTGVVYQPSPNGSAFAPQDMEIDTAANMIYVFSSITGDIDKIPVTGGAPTLVTATGNSPYALALAPNTVFYTMYDNNAGTFGLYKVSKNGGTVTRLDGAGATQLDLSNAFYMGDMTYNNGKLYIAVQNATSYDIIQADTTGLNATSIYSQSSGFYINNMAIAGGDIYWTESDGSSIGTLNSKNIASGAPVTMATFNNTSSVSGVVADAANNFVYTLVASKNGALSNVYRVPFGSTIPTLVNTLPVAANSIVFSTQVAPLPVALENYDAYLKSNNTVLLTWTTASEKNNDHFELSKSTDGTNFELLTTVRPMAQGNSTIGAQYQYTDKNPVAGTNYYKLKQVDVDGTVHEYGVRTIDIRKPGVIIQVYPNPFSGNVFNVEVSNMNEQIGYTITDIMGHTVIKGSVQGQKETVNMQDMPSGNYIINFSNGVTMQLVKK